MLGVGTILVARIVAERELAWYIREVLCFGLQEATLSKNRLLDASQAQRFRNDSFIWHIAKDARQRI